MCLLLHLFSVGGVWVRPVIVFFFMIFIYIFFPTFGAVTVAITIFNSIYLFALAGKKGRRARRKELCSVCSPAKLIELNIPAR